MALAERARYAARVRFESAKRPAGAKRLGLLALLCACGSGDSSLGLAPPESARAWGAFALEDRSFIASTELMPAGEPLELEADSDREAFVVAWTEFGLRGPIPSPRADDPLRRAAAGELALPAPMAAWRLDGESFEPEKPSSLPPLTRRAQNEGCEALTSQAAFVDSLCSELRCAPRAEWDGCVARLPPGLCTFNRGVTLGVSPEGVALPTVVLPNVFGPGKGLAALGYIEGEGAARRHKLAIAPFDGSGPRLGLGRLDLGEGVISQLVDDGRGHAIALLPWTGELLRIRPEP